jgi:hypothetical protein
MWGGFSVPKFSVETLFDKLAEKMKAEMNFHIQAINQLNDDLILGEIDDEAWIAGSLDERVNNFNQCAFYYIDDLQSIVNGPHIVTSIAIEFDLIFSQRDDFLDYKRLLRYQEALLGSASEAWGIVGRGYDKATITALNPIDIKLFNSSYWSKVIGVRFEFNLLNN